MGLPIDPMKWSDVNEKADKKPNAAADKAINADKGWNTKADKKSNIVTNEAVEADKKWKAAASKEPNAVADEAVNADKDQTSKRIKLKD